MNRRTFVTTLLSFSPLIAFAHTGQGNHGFLDGFMHPFLGLDHLLAMLLVGVWSILHARRIWLAPAVFVALLAAGVLLGHQGLSLAYVEPLVAASVLALGILLSKPECIAPYASLALIGGFALFHGFAHGSELSSGGAVLAGIVLGSSLLHAVGMAIAHLWLRKRPSLTLRLGQIFAAIGGGLIVNAIL